MRQLMIPTLLCLSLAAGCAAKKKPAPVEVGVADPALLETMRTAYAAQISSAKVGMVSEVLSNDMYVRVGEVMTVDFPQSQIVTIIDKNNKTIAHGTVASSMENRVDVKYTKTGDREPMIGDFVVRF